MNQFCGRFVGFEYFVLVGMELGLVSVAVVLRGIKDLKFMFETHSWSFFSLCLIGLLRKRG